MSQTSQEIIYLQKLYCFFKVLFLLRILLRTLDMVLLRVFFTVKFLLVFLADLKISLGLLEYFIFVWFCIFYLQNIS